MIKNNLILTCSLSFALASTIVTAGEQFKTSFTYSIPSDGPLEEEVEQYEMKVGGHLWSSSPEQSIGGVQFGIGAAFQANIWSFDRSDRKNFDVYKIKIPLSAGFSIAENIPMVLTVTPGLHGDFEEVDGDDARIEASLIGRYAASEDLTWVLGLSYGEEFGDPSVFPVVGAVWHPAEPLIAELIFPTPKVSFALNQDTRLFLAGEPIGGEWNVGEDDERSFDLQQKGYRVGLGGEIQVADRWWLHLMAGVELNRELQVGRDDMTLFEEEIELDDQAFFQLGLRLK